MNRRLGIVLALILVCVGSIALAEKKSAATVRIARAEGPAKEIVLNPSELTIDRTVPWQKTEDSDPSSDDPTLEFSSADGRSMAFELLFDEFESKSDVYHKDIAPIESLMLVDQELKRPPLLTFVWGSQQTFKGVIENLNVKYTLFLPDGTPCRATVNLKMKSASRLKTKKQ